MILPKATIFRLRGDALGTLNDTDGRQTANNKV
jgi:hypothetical protein